MDKVRDMPAAGDIPARLTVVGNRPVTMPCAHVYDKGVDGKPLFRFVWGPTVLTEWLKGRRK